MCKRCGIQWQLFGVRVLDEQYSRIEGRPGVGPATVTLDSGDVIRCPVCEDPFPPPPYFCCCIRADCNVPTCYCARCDVSWWVL